MKAWGGGGLFGGRTFWGPLALMVLTPPSAIVLWFLIVICSGSFQVFEQIYTSKANLVVFLYEIWPAAFQLKIWLMIFCFFLCQITLLRFVPGKPFYGPLTAQGNRPHYPRSNGLQTFVLSLCIFSAGAMTGQWTGGIIYDHLGQLLSSLNVLSLLLCLGLYFKGRFAPSSSDCGHSNNFVFDYYWGTELYPRVFGIDVKQITNCRGGMMFWGIAIISYAWKQYELFGYVSDSMVVNVALQTFYIAKFFYWETGYLGSIDIMHDRAGYYICWGCLVWVPAVYTSSTMYLVNHPIHLGFPHAAAISIIGLLAITANYLADLQRMHFRKTNAQCLIWGKKPTYIKAQYKTAKEVKNSLLLCSGWWGLSRHFHYIPEILGAFCWSYCSGFQNFIPYFYVIFLTFLLFDRAFRDDERCRQKYGVYWGQYCEKVPYLIIPKLI